MRHRAFLPLAIVLALVSGVVLAETRLVLLAPNVSLGADARVAANAALVRRFYAAANSAITTGEVASFDGIVAADFIDHAARPLVTADRAGLIRSLRALHATAPSTRLAVLDLLSQQDRVAALIRIEGSEDTTFLDLPVATNQLWGAVDVFRIAAGHIVEHWDDQVGPALFQPLLDVTVPVQKPTRKTITLERWTYAPDTSETGTTDFGLLVVLGDAGTLTIDVDARSRVPARLGTDGVNEMANLHRTIPPEATAKVRPGEALVVPQSRWFTIRNDGESPAVALVVRAVVPTPQTGPASTGAETTPPGIEHVKLAGGLAVNLPEAETTVGIGRMGLAHGAAPPPHRVNIAELVAVEAGTMAVAVTGGAAWITTDPTAATRRTDSDLVPTFGGAMPDAETTVEYRNGGTSALSLVVVVFGGGREAANAVTST
jgi:predicted SnoaL-like aldol condensation-catalyzing enzyme